MLDISPLDFYEISIMLPNIDFLFITSCLALGFGVSLASYRTFASRCDWPMGELHKNGSYVPLLLGSVTTAVALFFAGERQYYAIIRGHDNYLDGLWIIFCGMVWSILWTWAMRVSAQISLFLAPLVTIILIVSWMYVREPPGYMVGNRFVPYTYVARVPLPTRAPHHSNTKVWLAHGQLKHDAGKNEAQ